MASFSTSLCNPTLPEIIFVSPQNPTKRLKLSLYRPLILQTRSRVKTRGARIQAVQREDSAVLDEKDSELSTRLNSSVNGNGRYGYGNGSVEKYTNGTVKFEGEDDNLVKYASGNGNGNGSSEEVKVVKLKEVSSKKKSVEDIGQEDAWFKGSGQDQVEVHCLFIICYASISCKLCVMPNL